MYAFPPQGSLCGWCQVDGSSGMVLRRVSPSRWNRCSSLHCALLHSHRGWTCGGRWEPPVRRRTPARLLLLGSCPPVWMPARFYTSPTCNNRTIQQCIQKKHVDFYCKQYSFFSDAYCNCSIQNNTSGKHRFLTCPCSWTWGIGHRKWCKWLQCGCRWWCLWWSFYSVHPLHSRKGCLALQEEKAHFHRVNATELLQYACICGCEPMHCIRHLISPLLPSVRQSAGWHCLLHAG